MKIKLNFIFTCNVVTLLSSSEMYCNFLTLDLCADCLLAKILLTLLGSTTVSGEVVVAESCSAAASFLHELSSSTFSVFGLRSNVIAMGFSSLLLFWSEDGEEGLDADESGGGGSATAAMSSENMEISWSSSSRSKPARHSSRNGVSRKAMESLADRR
ncbi:hypothetical protein V8G54_025549 [Vigna mungo]|uniref:Uncharacterized protein n=1 Tax=Vigna mungo TaxID=3915 RepID=A0AAQ3MZ75_VIGMU